MSKRFLENASWVLKSVYYMYDANKITKTLKKRMSDKEIAKVLNFLEKKKLINVTEQKSGTPYIINLTDKGAEYISSKLKEERQDKFNTSVAFTGVILATIGIYNFVLQNLSLESRPNILLGVKTIFIITLLSCIVPLILIVIDFWKKLIVKIASH